MWSIPHAYHLAFTYLGFKRNEIADTPQASKQVTEQSASQNESLTENISTNVLLENARNKIRPYIQERCGTMRVLDMTQLIGLDDIYTKVNIFEEITKLKRSSQEELFQNANYENFERINLEKVREERVPGLEAVAKYSKLMILGKPGAGKTTFLKHIDFLVPSNSRNSIRKRHCCLCFLTGDRVASSGEIR